MAEDLHAVAPAHLPEGIPARGVAPARGARAPRIAYEQDAHGRYLVMIMVLVINFLADLLVGVTGLEAQRVGRELATAPDALDAIGVALDDLDAVAVALAGRGVACPLIAAIRGNLTAVLARAGRPTGRYHPGLGSR